MTIKKNGIFLLAAQIVLAFEAALAKGKIDGSVNRIPVDDMVEAEITSQAGQTGFPAQHLGSRNVQVTFTIPRIREAQFHSAIVVINEKAYNDGFLVVTLFEKDAAPLTFNDEVSNVEGFLRDLCEMLILSVSKEA
jgi:hypothetical protein